MIPLGILVALRSEALCLGPCPAPGGATLLAGGTRLVLAGVGPAAAEDAARALARAGARALASVGVAGGLDPALRPGELVLAERVRGAGGEELCVDPAWRAALLARLEQGAVRAGTIVESARVVATRAAKRELHEASGAAAVDMESAAIARVAREAGVPFLALRAISDAAGRELPPAAFCVDAGGRILFARLARALARDPRQLVTLLRLRSEHHAAQAALRRAWELAGPDLSAPA